jgi:hypothetical protein
MSRRFQFSLRTLLVAMLVVAAFLGGIRFEREWRRREDQAAALAAKSAERAAALARSRQWMAFIAAEMDVQSNHVAAEGETRERINRELFLQEQKVDRLMARFNVLMAEEQRRARLESSASETDESIREFLNESAK